jgi:AMP nucleosidase
MKTKTEIVKEWLPRYTGRSLDDFGKYILPSNFGNYVEMFAQRFGVEVLGRNHPMQSATAENLSVLNFGTSGWAVPWLRP